MGKWKTVPNFFPDYEDLDGSTQYHLSEGYCICGWLSKPSGSHYKKILVQPYFDSSFQSLLCLFDFDNWHKKWEIERNPFLKIFRDWKRKK